MESNLFSKRRSTNHTRQCLSQHFLFCVSNVNRDRNWFLPIFVVIAAPQFHVNTTPNNEFCDPNRKLQNVLMKTFVLCRAACAAIAQRTVCIVWATTNIEIETTKMYLSNLQIGKTISEQVTIHTPAALRIIMKLRRMGRQRERDKTVLIHVNHSEWRNAVRFRVCCGMEWKNRRKNDDYHRVIGCRFCITSDWQKKHLKAQGTRHSERRT